MIPDHDYETSNHWLSALTVDPQVITPTEIIDALAKENIESRPVWKPMHMQPVFEEYDFIGGNVAQSLYENGICLPSDSKMTDEEISKVIGTIKMVFN